MRKVLYIMGQLSDSDVDWLASEGSRIKVRKGDVLIKARAHPDALYIVLDGSLSVSTEHGEVINSIGCGEILGEMSFVDSSPASATVIASEDAIALAIKKEVLQKKIDEDFAFSSRFYKAISIFLADRLRKQMGLSTESELEEDELDESVLDSVYLAGTRFERMLKKLMG